jgi:TonB family protein
LEIRHVASANSSASRSSDAARAGAQPAAQPSADVTALTTRDDFLLELGQTLAGQAAVLPVDTVEAAIAGMSSSKRGQVLVIDARDVANVRAAVESAHAAAPHAVVLVFAESGAEKQLSASLKGSRVFAVLPTPLDPRKTQAVMEAAIADAVAAKDAAAAAPLAPLPMSTFRPQAAVAAEAEPPPPSGKSKLPLLIAAAVAVALAGSGAWFFTHSHGTPAATPAAAQPAASAAPAAAPAETIATPTADTSIVQGKVDELLEKARLAMHERRFTEPSGDNALLYYRSAAAAAPSNGEARDGLERVAGVLASRFDEAMNAGHFDEAALTLANFRSAAPNDARGATFEQRLYSTAIAKALADGNIDRAAAYVRQAQQSGTIPQDQLAHWRADIAHHQEDAKVQRLSGLIDDRIHDGRLVEGDDSAKSYLQQLQSAAAANPATQRAQKELLAAYLHRARDAALAKNNADEDRWLNEARNVGAKPADIAAFEHELSGARQKAAQLESDRLLQGARERLRDGRLTDPAQDSAAYYLTQLQASDPNNPQLAAADGELAGKLLERARGSAQAGRSADADLAQARRFGADPREIAAVQQLSAPAKSAAPAIDLATLAASLKQTRAVAPEYPQNALAQRVSGSVTLQYTVTTRGETRDVHVVEATPPGVFDQAAINAVKRWRYTPVVVNGTAVEVPASTRVRFELPKDK